MEAWGGDGGDVAALEDAGGAAHAVALGDAAGAGRRGGGVGVLGEPVVVGGHGEGEDVGAAAHVGFAEGPMHGFAGAPRHAELRCNGVPEFGLEAGRGSVS